MTITTILAIWGSILSTTLFFFKILELRKNSFHRLRVQFHSDSYNKVNTFTVINYSANPINISYYEAFYACVKKSKDKLYIDFGIDGDLVNVHIKPHEKQDLKLDEAYYFNPHSDRFTGKRLFITLYETGTRKVITKRVK